MNRPPVWLAWLLGIVPMLGFWLTGLFDLDEGYYAAVVGEMNRRGEWITPYFNGAPWFEKPILLYWLAKPSVMLLGPAGARFSSFLCTALLLGACALFARRLSEEAARLAPLVGGGMLLVALYGRLLMTDAALTLFLALALFLAWSAAESGSARDRALAGVMLGLATLAKGPVALILFVPPMVVGSRALGFGARRVPGGWWGFLGAYALVNAAWYVPAYLANGPVFVQRFFVEQNLGRFTGGDAAHTLGLAYFWIFLPIALLGALPYTPWALRVWSGGDARHTFLRAWALWVLLFFSLSGAKLPNYILPMFPPLVVLVADKLAERGRNPSRVFLYGGIWCVALSLVLNGAQLWWFGASGQAEANRLIEGVAPGENLVLYQLSRRKRERGTGSATIQETSLPSLAFVANRVTPDAETLAPYLGDQRLTVFTRTDRLGAEEAALLRGAGLREVSREAGAHYVLVRYAR